MFVYVKGILKEAQPTFVVLDLNGLGYRIFIPASAFGHLPQLGEALLLHTSFIIREFSQALYGFLSVQERDVFEDLMNVSGIGPKLALSIIGHLSLQDLQKALAEGDIRLLSKVPGIGKKTAERMIIELRDKLSHLAPLSPSDYATHTFSDPKTQMVRDAMSALVNLGYNQAIAQKAIKKSMQDLPEGIDLASLITSSLKNV